MYFQNILKRNDHELVKKIYKAQQIRRTKYDFYHEIELLKNEYHIDIQDEDIQKMSKNSFKEYIDKKLSDYFYHELLQCNKSKVSKLVNVIERDKNGKIKMQEYLKSNRLSTKAKQALFSLRCRNFPVKTNMKTAFGNNLECRICHEENSIENEEHTFFNCSELVSNADEIVNIQFDDIYGNIHEQVRAMNYFMHIIEKRKIILELAERRQ